MSFVQYSRSPTTSVWSWKSTEIDWVKEGFAVKCWDMFSIIYFELIELKPSYHRKLLLSSINSFKWPAVLANTRKVLFHHDNVRPHIVRVTLSNFENLYRIYHTALTLINTFYWSSITWQQKFLFNEGLKKRYIVQL